MQALQTTAVLATAQVKLRYNDNITETLRCLCKSGAQVNLITTRCAQDNGLKIHPSAEQIVGIGGSERVMGVTYARLHNRHAKDMNLPLRFIVVTRVALNLASTLPFFTIFENSASDSKLDKVDRS